jgi:hypothetical protein
LAATPRLVGDLLHILRLEKLGEGYQRGHRGMVALVSGRVGRRCHRATFFLIGVCRQPFSAAELSCAFGAAEDAAFQRSTNRSRSTLSNSRRRLDSPALLVLGSRTGVSSPFATSPRTVAGQTLRYAAAASTSVRRASTTLPCQSIGGDSRDDQSAQKIADRPVVLSGLPTDLVEEAGRESQANGVSGEASFDGLSVTHAAIRNGFTTLCYYVNSDIRDALT